MLPGLPGGSSKSCASVRIWLKRYLSSLCPVIHCPGWMLNVRHIRVSRPMSNSWADGWMDGRSHGSLTGHNQGWDRERRRLPAQAEPERAPGPLCCRKSPCRSSRAGNRRCLCGEREQKMAFPERCLCPCMCWLGARMETLSSWAERERGGARDRGAPRQRELK